MMPVGGGGFERDFFKHDISSILYLIPHTRLSLPQDLGTIWVEEERKKVEVSALVP